MNHFMRPFPAEAGNVAHVYGITTEFVIKIAEESFAKLRAWIVELRVVEGACDGEVKGCIAPKIPAGIAKTFGLARKAGAIGAFAGIAGQILCMGDDLTFTLSKERLIQFFLWEAFCFRSERIT